MHYILEPVWKVRLSVRTDSEKFKVLIPHRLGANIYVQQLGRAYQELGCSVVYGAENFVESNLEFDIIHLNWPEEIYNNVKRQTSRQ